MSDLLLQPFFKLYDLTYKGRIIRKIGVRIVGYYGQMEHTPSLEKW